MTTTTFSDLDRLMNKIALPVDTDGCWTWKGAKHSKSRGYGKFRMGEKVMNAHKAAYLIFKGEIDKGLVVAHQCNNEACVNPEHLKLETQSQNMKYCVMSGRHNSCKKGN
jgi:hypothetical protein